MLLVQRTLSEMLCPIYDETLVVYNTKPLRISNWLILIEQVLNDLRNRLCFLDYCQNVVELCNLYFCRNLKVFNTHVL